jgi:solute:Na+ symporter, SSS family
MTTLRRMGIVAMIYIVVIAGGISIYAESLVGITKYLFAITAGVGPVFMLRWYWWRINAWSQLSAMVAALVYPPILDALFENNVTVHQLVIR